ncbi:hypothetical protein YC2023_012484 [Brassica napus]
MSEFSRSEHAKRFNISENLDTHRKQKRTDEREALRLQHHPHVIALEPLPLPHPWSPRSHLRRHHPRSRSTLYQNPVLYLSFPQGRMKLFGTILYPKNRYLTLQFFRGGKNVLCDDYFDNMKIMAILLLVDYRQREDVKEHIAHNRGEVEELDFCLNSATYQRIFANLLQTILPNKTEFLCKCPPIQKQENIWLGSMHGD